MWRLTTSRSSPPPRLRPPSRSRTSCPTARRAPRTPPALPGASSEPGSAQQRRRQRRQNKQRWRQRRHSEPRGCVRAGDHDRQRALPLPRGAVHAEHGGHGGRRHRRDGLQLDHEVRCGHPQGPVRQRCPVRRCGAAPRGRCALPWLPGWGRCGARCWELPGGVAGPGVEEEAGRHACRRPRCRRCTAGCRKGIRLGRAQGGGLRCGRAPQAPRCSRASRTA